MKKIILVLSCILFGLVSCSSDDETSVAKDQLDLNILSVGQESLLVMYQSQCGQFPETLNFTGDTLRWRVIHKQGNRYLVEEAFTRGSTLSQLEPIRYNITNHSDYVLIPERFSSNLFFFYGNDTIFKNPLPVLRLEQDACNFVDSGNTIFTGDAIAEVGEAQFGQRQITNQLLVSCVPIKLNLNGYILYSEGKISSIHSYNAEGTHVQGWMPI